MPTRYETHKEQWKNCRACFLSRKRTKMVHYRGKIPADILCIGEGPGKSEDALGKPFVGPAGKLLDVMLQAAMERAEQEFRVGYTNLIACIPLEPDSFRKLTAPPSEAIEACSAKLEDMIDIANPRLIVAVGKEAEKELKQYELEPKLVAIMHPAAILRADITQRGLLIQRNEAILFHAITELEET